jgi:hypothetical protein
VFAIKVRTKFISRDDALALARQFREDLVTGRVEVFGIREAEMKRAEQLIERYALDLRLRALDAIQVAVALALRDQNFTDYFVAADKVLCEVATLEGFSVINPETL